MLELQLRVADSKHDGLLVDVGGWATRATLDIIGVAGLGHDFGALKDPSNEVSVTFNKIFAPGLSGKILGIAGFFLPPWIVRNIPYV